MSQAPSAEDLALDIRLAMHAAYAEAQGEQAIRLECAVTGPGQICLDVVDTIKGETKTILFDPGAARKFADSMRGIAAAAERR
jgi:hypothetical protein